MTNIKIAKIGDPILAKVSNPVPDSHFGSDMLSSLIGDMFEVMHEEGGVGLAAPQIGIGSRVIVFGIGEKSRMSGKISIPDTVLVNPKITYFSEEMEEDYEGCLSVGEVMAKVPRSKFIKYEGFDVSGRKIEKEAQGFEARVVQHELDHLDGIIFLERVKDKKSFIRKEELRKGTA